MESAQRNSYQYTRSLTSDQIRLVSIKESGGIHEHSVGLYQPFDPHDVIVCSMEVHSRSDAPAYDALSYTWANPFDVFESRDGMEKSVEIYKTQLPVLCDDQVLFVGASLYDALWALRRSSRMKQAAAWKTQTGTVLSKLLWIDAICINQTDMNERNVQVAMMNTIYRRAANVLVWLGPDDAFVYPAFELLQLLSNIPLDDAIAHRHSGSLEKLDYAALGVKRIPLPQWCALYALLARTWFRRSWIVQEITLASNAILMSGNNMMSWSTLGKAGLVLEFSKWHNGMTLAAQDLLSTPKLLNPENRDSTRKLELFQISEEQQTANKPSALPVLIHQVFNLHFMLGMHGVDPDVLKGFEDLSLLSLLVSFRYAECFNARDKVYAMCGIWHEYLGNSPDPSLLVNVDYNRTIEEVYLHAAWSILRQCRDLRLLSHVTVSDLEELPSWTPDWSAEEQVYAMDATRASGSKPWKAAGDLKWPSPERIPQLSQLQVEGIHIDSIAFVADYEKEDLTTLWPLYECLPKFTVFKPETSDILNYQRTFSDDEAGPKHKILQLPTFERTARCSTRMEVLWRTVLCDIWDEGEFAHPAPFDAGLAFVSTLAGRALYHLYTSTDAASRAEAEQRLAILNRFGRDEAECISLIDDIESPEGSMAADDEFTWQYWKAVQGTEQEALAFLGDPQVSRVTHTWRDWESRVLQNDGRKLFATGLGLAGNGHRSIQVGDEVWAIAGCDELCVLRKASAGFYRFVGVTYVHGLMHGELFVDNERKPTKLEVITLE